jgi:Protein of unknown function (DUF3634)
MPLWLQIAIAALAVAALVQSARRQRELCVLSVRNGRTLRLRGKLPGEARIAINDVLARARPKRGTIRVLVAEPRAELVVRGIDAETAQRLRNVVGTFTLARLRSGDTAHRRNLGQRLGIEWLAWYLHERRA